MKRLISLALATAMMTALVACGSEDNTTGTQTNTGNSQQTTTTTPTVKTGMADGFGGKLEVSVTMEGTTIKSVEVTSHSETAGISDPALATVPEAIVTANSADVDIASGATVSSNAIMSAVKNAMDPVANPYVEPQKEVVALAASDLYRGVGTTTLGSSSSKIDDEGYGYYSLNQVFANALFDADGKILAITIDQMEIGTPNNAKETLPTFYGWPGQSYSYDDDNDGTIDGVVTVDEDMFLEMFLDMQTKRERTDYNMTSGSWAEQFDVFEAEMVGKTIAEVLEWHDKYFSDETTRIIKITDSSSEADIAKFEALTEDEQAYLTDVTTGASISLTDYHGDILQAIVNAYDNREAVVDVSKVSAHGSGVSLVGRLGPGSDNDMSTYSYNEVFVYTLFDDEGKILNLKVDQFEVKSGNTDGVNPFTGWVGIEYGDRVNADIDALASQMFNLTTKNDQGDSYAMTAGSWENQMNAYEAFFVGMTVAEVEEWYAKSTFDSNGRPLNITEDTAEEDVAKFEKLSAEEQEALVDLTASATMSLNDSHGDIIKAIVKSYENRSSLDITIG